LFLFRLAAQLGMTVAELCERMTSTELSEWMAVHRYFMPLQDSWHQTGVLAASVLAPHRGNGKPARPADFVPIEQPPQHPVQREETLRELYQQLRGE
jgi:hypothetical protein